MKNQAETTHVNWPKRPRAETAQAETTLAETTQGRNGSGRNDPGRNDPGPKRLMAETTRYSLEGKREHFRVIIYNSETSWRPGGGF